MPALEKPIDFGVPEQEAAPAAPHRVDLATVHVQPDKPRSNALLWIVAAVFILLALSIAGVAVVLLVTKSSNDQVQDPPGIEQPASDDGAPSE